MDTEKNNSQAKHNGYKLTEGFDSKTNLTYNKDEDDDYNPFEHRIVEKPTSALGALAHLLKGCLGTGVLAMPMAFFNSGLLFGLIGTIVVGFCCTYCAYIFVQTSNNVCKKMKIPSLGFTETAIEVFKSGPPILRKFSGVAGKFCDGGMLAAYLGTNCIYIVFISQSMRDLLTGTYPLDWDIRVYIAITTVPVLLIGQVRELKYLVPFSAVANLFYFIVLSITLYFVFDSELVFEDKPLFASWGTLPLFFSTVVFAMEGIGVVMPLENSMRKPQYFLGCPGVLNGAFVIVVVLYALIGFLGYVRFGPEIAGSITLNLPQEHALAIVAKSLIVVAILFTFGLQYFVPIDIIWRKIKHRVDPKRYKLAEAGLRTGIIIILAGIAMAVPDLEPFISLVGAIFFSSLGLLIPSVVETVYRWPNGLGFMKWVLWKNLLLIAFSLIALVSGATVSIINIIKIYTG